LALDGLKPLRPANLFEMAVIAITEQQLSLAAAFYIRSRLVKQFGTRVGDLWRFPTAERLAIASVKELTECGLSHRKAEYVKELAKHLRSKGIDFNLLSKKSDQTIYNELIAIRGFGQWSAQYVLARGFGRPDALPSGDAGLQVAVGSYLSSGRKLSAADLECVLLPFRPFRALAAYYLAVHWRLRRRNLLERWILVKNN
jgi:DNA-3-methyladenine glycosylase II